MLVQGMGYTGVRGYVLVQGTRVESGAIQGLGGMCWYRA